MEINKACRIGVGLVALFSLLGCHDTAKKSENEAAEQGSSEAKAASNQPERQSIWMETVDDSGNPSIQLKYANPEEVGPRVAEIFLKHSGNLTYKNSVKGDSLTKSDKQLVVQEIEKGMLRVVILSAENTNSIGTGTLLTAMFEKTNDQPGRIEILTEQPLFAPEEANEGLIVGDPVTL
jgi:hypothetical protein